VKRARVAAVQTGPDGVSAADIAELVSAADSADLVLLPELCHLPYFPLEHSPDWPSQAIRKDDPFVDQVREIAAAANTYIVLPLYLEDGRSRRNSALFIGPDGRLLAGVDPQGRSRPEYSKTHLCDIKYYGAEFYESEYFTPGDGFTLWDTPLGRVGILICYDRHFPEAWRTLRASGAEIVCVPVASPDSTRATFLAEMQAMALQQGVYVMVANRAGSEYLSRSGRRTTYLGQSCVIGPDGALLAVSPARRRRVLAVADIGPEPLERIRTGFPLAEHRRPSTYQVETAGPRGAGGSDTRIT
jgi:N-carbamoylputrescine amidase